MRDQVRAAQREYKLFEFRECVPYCVGKLRFWFVLKEFVISVDKFFYLRNVRHNNLPLILAGFGFLLVS
jgi:hypothetical protein